MAASSSLSSSSSSQGLAPGVLGKDPQTPGDLIIYSLEDLIGCDFKRFRNKLSDFSYGDKLPLPLPRGRLENADWITTKDILIDTFGEEEALDVTIKIFTLIGLMGPANDLQERRAQNAKLKKMAHSSRLSEFGKEYKDSSKERFQRIKEYNSRIGEAVNLQKRFTKLFMKQGHQNKEEKEQEIRSSGRRHLQSMEKRPSDQYSPITIQALFDPDEDGFTPKIVVLQGPAGIGKTMTSMKIMLDWASGNLYEDKFDFVFYLSCREIYTIPGDISLVGLLSRACRLQSSGDLVSILKDPKSHRKLLFLVDGFDELRWTLEEESEVFLDISKETHKEIILQRLLRKQVLPQSSLIITTRSLAMEKLNTFIEDSRNVKIHGFTGDNREEYVHKFFGNKEDATKVLSIIKDNVNLYTMCAIPITCWIVCTVMKQEIKKDLGLIRCNTMTSIYLLYLEVLITHHSKKDQSVHRKQTCLKKLCALANEGALKLQILFEKKDLDRHGLSLDEVESVFLNKNIFHWDVRTQACYSFIHLSVQEFLAALYYVLDDGAGFMKRSLLSKICKGLLQDDPESDYFHLALAIQFLFGFFNEKLVRTFSEITGINISPQVLSAVKSSAMKNIGQSFHMLGIFYLYETQDEDLIRSVMSRLSRLKLYDLQTGRLLNKNNNYSKQLSYCLKTLKNESFQSLYFFSLTMGPECQKDLSPFIHRCQKVSFQTCNISSKDCSKEDRAEDADESSSAEDEDESASEDKMESANLSWLINPESKIRKIDLDQCGVTSSCCADLRSILITNRFLTTLHLSNNNLQDSGIKLLCEGLKHPRCTLQKLSLCDCQLTLSCCDDLCSVITTNRTLTILWATLDDDEKMSVSEVEHFSEVLQNASFMVNRAQDGGGWTVFACKRRLINSPWEYVNSASDARCSIL